jgi:hypothetical protein
MISEDRKTRPEQSMRFDTSLTGKSNQDAQFDDDEMGFRDFKYMSE